MEALLFRWVIEDLRPLLTGRRLEQIFSPRQGWWTFRLQPSEHYRFLLFSHHPSPMALALAPHAPQNPAQPSAQVMRLRKHLRHLRILDLHSEWVHRRLILELGRKNPSAWLVLDSRHGVFLTELPSVTSSKGTDAADAPAAGASIVWPTWDQIRSEAQIWQNHPHLSPLLRRTLDVLPEDQGRSLLDALQSDDPPQTYAFYRASRGTGQLSTACPWSLPESMREGRVMVPCRSALEGANLLADELFFAHPLDASGSQPNSREIKRIARLHRNLDADQRRLQGYVRLAEQAEMIRNNLYRLSAQNLTPRSKTPVLSLSDSHERSIELTLDSRLTILENMQRWFQLAEKGRRGLKHLQERRDQLQKAPLLGRTGPLVPGDRLEPHPNRRPALRRQSRRTGNPQRSLPLHRFLSSDGIVLLRGKNQKANHLLLTKMASPFDFWMHAADGPGAHLILKRNAPGQEIPDQTLEEAAALAGLASHFAAAGRATIICALVKHVRPVRGVPGMAVADRILRTLNVLLDPDLEEKLRLES